MKEEEKLAQMLHQYTPEPHNLSTCSCSECGRELTPVTHHTLTTQNTSIVQQRWECVRGAVYVLTDENGVVVTETITTTGIISNPPTSFLLTKLPNGTHNFTQMCHNAALDRELWKSGPSAPKPGLSTGVLNMSYGG